MRETADRPMTRMNDEDFANWSPGEAMLADRAGLAFDWLEIEDDGESFAALRALPQADKQTLFAACVARTVKGQLAFEPQARPELEATVARLDIDFARHVRPTADMLWSRINKSRILDIARTIFGAAWASARAKNKKPALAAAMELAFAAGDPPVGVTADMHAAALAWMPPGFAAFDTGRVDEEAGGDDADPVAAPDASAPDGGPAAEAEPAAPAESPADPPPTSSAVESIDSPAEAERVAAARDAANGNGHAAPAAPETAPAGSDADDDGQDAGTADVAMPTDVAAAADPIPPAHINGRHALPTRWRSPSSSAGSTRPLSERPARHLAPGPRAGGSPAGRFLFDTSHGGPRMTRIATTPPTTIRARIHDSAIRRVTRIYASTLSDVMTEALQNSRRGGATRVRIAIDTLTDPTRRQHAQHRRDTSHRHHRRRR